MIIFDQKLKEEFVNYRYDSTPYDERHKLNGADLAFVAAIIRRIAEDYDCSHSSTFTWEEEELARMLRRVYGAGYNKACDWVKERVLPPIEAMGRY